MKRIFRIILATVFILTLSFISSCAALNEEYVTIGFDNSNNYSFDNSNNYSTTRNRWVDGIELGIKYSKKTSEKQNVNLYFGISRILKVDIKPEIYDASDFNQILKFSLYRYDLEYNDYNLDNGKLVYTFNNTLEYFFSDEFDFKNTLYTDEITVKDLTNNKNKRQILYQYELEPLEDEYIQIASIAKEDLYWPDDNGNQVKVVEKGDIIGPDVIGPDADNRYALFKKITSLKHEISYTINENEIKFGS